MATIKLSELGEVYSLGSSDLLYVVSDDTSYKITKANVLSDVYSMVGDLTSIETTDKTSIVSAINENKNRLDDLTYTEVVTLASNMTVPANNSPATQTYTLSPKTGYTPILATLANTYNGVINLWYVSLNHSTNQINWRIHNVSSSQATAITVRVEVLYIKTDSYLGAF